MLNEYPTSELLEITYLYFKGFPIAYVDRENEHKMVVVFGVDKVMAQSLLKDVWECRKEEMSARDFFNAHKAVKQLLWVGGQYNPSYAKQKQYGDKNIRPADQQEKQQATDKGGRKNDRDSVKGV